MLVLEPSLSSVVSSFGFILGADMYGSSIQSVIMDVFLLPLSLHSTSQPKASEKRFTNFLFLSRKESLIVVAVGTFLFPLYSCLLLHSY
jgi:hypothetical protein